jgi:hypothetical protein
MKMSFTATALVLFAIPASATTVPFDVQVPLVLKALTYDRSLKSRVGEKVRIAVLSPPGRGRQAIESLMTSLTGLPDGTIGGVPVTFREIAAPSNAVESLEQALRVGRWAAVYAMPGFTAEELNGIRQLCESHRVLLVGAAGDDVERGTAFGIAVRDGKPLMVVNLAITRACGSEFDLALLRLARVIQ